MPFPLPFVPRFSYRVGGRRFGADRQNGRKHAGCDLLAPEDTPIYAIADGVVIEASNKEFYHHTKAMVIRHGGFLVRYCEVKGFGPGIRAGKRVAAGDVVAYVGKMLVSSMLHFEVYAGTLTGPLTVRRNTPFQRRADLINPTAFLDRLARELNQSRAAFEPIASADAVSE
jgi:murein DD-endopeptidase MepM/ murein hydrolase activator NlpD